MKRQQGERHEHLYHRPVCACDRSHRLLSQYWQLAAYPGGSIEKHRIPGIKGSFYVITVMDAFSRATLSSDIFQSQDLACVLIVFYAAVEQFGAPQRLITDNGGVYGRRFEAPNALCRDDSGSWMRRLCISPNGSLRMPTESD